MRLPVLLLAAFAALAVFAVPATCQQPFDLILRGGVVVDGTGRPPLDADVAIRGERIAAIGDLRGLAALREIDCKGLAIAPGFIDVHAHVDSTVVRHPACGNYLQMGVTTLITGNCGSSVKDLAAHFGRVERGGIGCNYGSLVGLGTVRSEVLGTEERAPTDDELKRMQLLVEEGMQAGAFGVSTGLIYVPGTYAETEEIAALARVAGKYGGIYATHMRNENDHVLTSIEEALRIGREAGCAVHVSHIKCSGKPNWGRAAEVLAVLEAARRSGQRVTADQYAYDASSTGLDVLFPSSALSIGRAEFGRRLHQDPEFRAEMKQALFQTMDKVGFGDLSYARIAGAANNEDLAGMTIAEAAAKKLGRSDRDAQAEMAMNLFAEAGGQRVGMVYHSMGEADVAKFMAVRWIAIAADAGVREPSANKPHPRGSGNNARVLGRYVRELGVLDLATAVHKMTLLPAQTFGIRDRGEIRLGAFADLVVFDPATVADRATWQEPLEPPVGIPTVIVNGRLAVEKGEVTKDRSGKVLRFAIAR